MFAADFGVHVGRDYTTSSSLVPAMTMVPQWKQKGRVEHDLFGATSELEQRVTDEFLTEMAKEAREEREKREAEIRKQEEAVKKRFLKDKWQKIIDSMSMNYKGVDAEADPVDPRIAAEIKRCMVIPSEFLRTRLVTDCPQCSQGVWKDQEHYKPLRHPQDESLDFDGHFPEDHVVLKGFEARTKAERDEYTKSLVPAPRLYGGAW